MSRISDPLVDFDWSRVSQSRFDHGDLQSALLDGQRFEIRPAAYSARRERDLRASAERPLRWTFDGSSGEICPIKITTFQARLKIILGDRSLMMVSRLLGFDIVEGHGLQAKQRRMELQHRSGVDAEVLAACLAINALRLDRRLTAPSVAVDNIGLLGRGPELFAPYQ